MDQKSLLLLLVSMVVTITSFSQVDRSCPTVYDPALMQTQDPERYGRFQQVQANVDQYRQQLNNSGSPNSRIVDPNAVIVIPVVVHILHQFGEPVGSGMNLSDQQILSQIAVLNEDFRRTNLNASSTPTQFQPVAVDTRIEFRLACVDPNGNPSNGITRTRTSITAFSNRNDGIKNTSSGGKDPWPTDKYLNVWVGPLAGNLLGYGQFPADYYNRPMTDGVVVHYRAFGNIGDLFPYYDKGRTLTHEVGHWLDVYHIFGPDETCSGSDYCDDTPNQGVPTRRCPSTIPTSCGNSGNMFVNYMDYSDDVCMSMFTRDQSVRMRANFFNNGVRTNIVHNAFRISSSSRAICGNSGTLSLTNINCLTPNWSVVSGPLQIIGGQGTNQITLQATSNGTAVVRVTANGYVDEIELSVGLPNAVNYISVWQQICGAGVQWWLDPIPWQPNTVFNWQFTNVQYGTVLATGQSVTAPMYVHLGGSQGTSYEIQVTPQNECGNGPTYTTIWGLPCDDGTCCIFYRVSATPNPAKSDVFVTLSEEKDVVKQQKDKTVQMELVNTTSGAVAKRWKFLEGSSQYRLNIADVIPGHYLLRVSKGQYKQTTKILVER